MPEPPDCLVILVALLRGRQRRAQTPTDHRRPMENDQSLSINFTSFGFRENRLCALHNKVQMWPIGYGKFYKTFNVFKGIATTSQLQNFYASWANMETRLNCSCASKLRGLRASTKWEEQRTEQSHMSRVSWHTFRYSFNEGQSSLSFE